MAKKILFAKSNLKEDRGNKEIKKCDDLDKNDYETKYRGHLTCYKGCDARIKFTERKNGLKYFSTWNGDGNLHNKKCPYHVDYKGRIGRKKLDAIYEECELDDDTIQKRLKDKMNRLLHTYSRDDIEDARNGSNRVDNTGNKDVSVSKNVEKNENDTDTMSKEKGHNLSYQDANYTTVDDINCRLGLFGYVDNVQLGKDEHGKSYAYFNLYTDSTTVNILFPEAFYSNEINREVTEFERYINYVKEIVEQADKKILCIAYGKITKKKKDKNGVNLSVISPKRIIVDNKTYKEILNRKGSII